MDYNKLQKIQSALDERIVKEKGLQNVNVINKKILALIVEFGEMANETRCFKYWSEKKPSARKVILEEYVDGFHFFLSLANEKQINLNHEMKITEKYTLLETDKTDLILSIIAQVIRLNEIRVQNSRQPYIYTLIKALHGYLFLGYLLGFTENEITDAYYLKNAINHERQNLGY